MDLHRLPVFRPGLADEQLRSGFRYAYSVYQVEYSRNLFFAAGTQDGTAVRHRGRPHPVPAGRAQAADPVRREATTPPDRAELSPRLAAMIETPGYDLTIFKVHFGLLTLKALHQRRTRAAVRGDRAQHQALQLPAAALDKFPDIVARLAGMVERFTTTLDCVDIGFLPDGILDRAARTPRRSAPTRVGGIDLNRPRMRDRAGRGPRPGRRARTDSPSPTSPRRSAP